MTPEIKVIEQKKLVGMRLLMSLTSNKTFELWSKFMPQRKEIQDKLNSDFISMQVYDDSYNFKNFDFNSKFEKWATVEVNSFYEVPDGMETFILPSGMYAVFFYKGDASGAEKMFRYIFETWLPTSGYALDSRPHYEILGSNYKNNDPNSEEEIYIPIKII